MKSQFHSFKEFISEKLQSQLSPMLTYHGYHHTLHVANSANEIAGQENISQDDMILLQTAVWLHDAGFIYTYTNHEARGCEMARELLPGFGYSPAEIDIVCHLIDATKIPQKPQSQLEKIIADADLMYLGTLQYSSIAETLFEELKHFTTLREPSEWLQIQIQFLEKHRYHTAYCRSAYEAMKQTNLSHLKNQ